VFYGKPLKITDIKAVGDDWMVDGYPSTFDNTDLGDDIVMPGAFKETLKSGPRVRFMLSHDPRLVLGVPKLLREDDKGLFGSFKISRTQLGSDTHQLLLDEALDSFSIGYEAIDFDFTDKKIRRLKTVKLYEVSLVPIPMNPEAIVTRVKEYLSLADRTREATVITSDLLKDLRNLVGSIDHPLSETKRKELTELLGLCLGLDAVQSELRTVLSSTIPTRLVGPKMINRQMADTRKRLQTILME
jgi:hypothetical protein